MIELSRRRFIAGVGTAAAASTLAACNLTNEGVDSSRDAPVDVNVALLTDTNCVMAAAVARNLQQTGLFEETAAGLGHPIHVTWKQFPYAPQLIADAASGGVQLGTIATFPIMNGLANGQNIQPVHVSFGSWEFMIIVQPNGSIRNFEDLRGKTVGVALGTTLQEFFEVFCQLELGGSSQMLDIELVNQGVPAASMPPGIDAIVTYIPAWLSLENKSELQMLVNSFGETGPAYAGPLGTGAGLTVPSVSKSPFRPEGYVALRQFFCTFGDFGEQHPEIVEAWALAYQQTIRSLNSMTSVEITDIFPTELWDTIPREPYAELSIGRDLLYLHRDWIWPTEGELQIMLAESELMADMGLIPSPLNEDQILDAFTANMPAVKRAFTELAYPPHETFLDPTASDLRGLPLWEL